MRSLVPGLAVALHDRSLPAYPPDSRTLQRCLSLRGCAPVFAGALAVVSGAVAHETCCDLSLALGGFRGKLDESSGIPTPVRCSPTSQQASTEAGFLPYKEDRKSTRLNSSHVRI